MIPRWLLLMLLLLPLVACEEDRSTPTSATGQPTCAVAPTAIDFDTVVVGGSADDTFTIENTGSGTLSGNVSLSCPYYGFVSGGGSYSLAAAESLAVTVRFQPTEAGTHLCIIETGSSLCGDISLTGVGEAPPACAVVPSGIDFGTVTVGTGSDDSYTITNTGGGTLTGNISESCPHYSIISGGGAYDLTAAQSRIVTVRFQPSVVDIHGCTVDNGGASCVDVELTGVGGAPPYEIKYETGTASGWFGGDDRTGFGPRDIGVGCSVLIDADIVLESFALNFTRRFDFDQNPDYIGHDVTLDLNIRNAAGVTLGSVQLNLPASFNGGWATWTGINMNVDAGTTLIFTAYLVGAYDTNQVYSGARGDADAGYAGGVRFTGYGTSDTDMESWTIWDEHPWDSWFWLRGSLR